MRPKSSAALPTVSPWDIIVGSLSCLIVLAVPFFPDEKVVRLKLEAFELGIFVLASIVFVRMILSGRRTRINIRLGAIPVWVAATMGLWFLSPEKSLANAELRRVFFGAGAFFTFTFAGLTPVWRRRALLSWSFSGGLVALYGVLQRFGGIFPVQVPQMHRVMGTFGNPIFFGAFLVATIFITLAALSSQPGSLKIPLVISLAVQIIALYFTETRASWLAFVAAMAAGAVLKFGIKRVPVYVWLGLLAAVFVFGVKASRVWGRDQGHLLIWRDTLRMAKDHPVAGVGLGAFHVNFPDYADADLRAKWPKDAFIVNYAHNEYLQTLAEGGVLAFLPFMAVIGGFLWFAWREIKSTADPTFLPLTLAVVGLLVQNFFSVDMRFAISFGYMFVLMGLLVGLSDSFPATGPFSLARSIGALSWIGFMGGIVFPALMRPYRAERLVSATPGFFDERVLDPAKSIEDLEKLAAQYPNEPQVLEKLAYVYAKEMKSPDGKINRPMTEKAVGAYERLIAADPTRVAAYNNLANIQYTLGHVDEAIGLWRKAVHIKPDFLDVHLNLGKVLYTRGDLKEAAAHFQKVLELDPGNAEAIVYLKRMVE